jgi:hypothetical protein
MSRISRSFELVKMCLGVLRLDKELLLFPVVSALALLVVSAAFAVPSFFAGLFSPGGQALTVAQVIVAFCFYFVCYFVIIYFNSGLVGAALIRLRGGDPTLRDGFREASSHLPAIIGYAALSATVGLVLRLLRDRGGIVGAIGSAVAGVAWSLATFLAVPVLVVEGIGPVAAIKRSAQLLKKTWGEQIIGSAGIGLVFFLAGLVAAAAGGVLVWLAFSASAGLAIALIALTVAAILGLSLVGATLQGIYSAAVYDYAVTGEPGGLIPGEVVRDAFRVKPSARW